MSALTNHPPLTTPVLLPHVRVEVDHDAGLVVTVDQQPYAIPAGWADLGRQAVPRIVEEITTRLATPIRIEVADAGSTYTDIVTPNDHSIQQPSPGAAPASEAAITLSGDVAGGGFSPNEPVAIAVVVAHRCADANGFARLRLPPALLTNRPGLVVLLGQNSGTVAVSGGTE